MATTVTSVIIGYHYVGSSPTYIGSTQCVIIASYIGTLSLVDSLCAAQVDLTASSYRSRHITHAVSLFVIAHVFIVSDSSDVGRVSILSELLTRRQRHRYCATSYDVDFTSFCPGRSPVGIVSSVICSFTQWM